MHQRLFKNGSEFCSISDLRIRRGKIEMQAGTPVGKDPDACSFTTTQPVGSFDPLTDEFSIVNPEGGSARTIVLVEVVNGRSVTALFREE